MGDTADGAAARPAQAGVASTIALAHDPQGILQVLLDYLPSGVTLFGPDLKMIACNAKLREMLDFPDELFADGLPSLPRLLRFNAERGEYGPGDPATISAKAVERARKMKPHVFERVRPNGVVLEVRGTPLPGGGFVTIYTDITEKKQAEKRIQHLAHHDSLTGLPNRLLFSDRLAQAIIRAKRDSLSFSLLYLDLDKFKPVNDTLGHDAGDELLRSVAARICQQVRESDTVARVGGDEFSVILLDAHDRDNVAAVAEKIIAALDQPFYLERHKCSVDIGTSIGIAFYPDDAKDNETLVKLADAAMYKAKTQRSCFRFFDD